jgi:hypothetical protein
VRSSNLAVQADQSFETTRVQWVPAFVEQQELWARHQRVAIATIVQAWPQPASA